MKLSIPHLWKCCFPSCSPQIEPPLNHLSKSQNPLISPFPWRDHVVFSVTPIIQISNSSPSFPLSHHHLGWNNFQHTLISLRSFFLSFKSLSHNYTILHKISQMSFPIRSPKNTSYNTLHVLVMQAYPTSLPLPLPAIPTAQATLAFLSILLLSCLHTSAFYCSHCLDFWLFPQPLKDGSFSSFRSQLKRLPLKKPSQISFVWSNLC